MPSNKNILFTNPWVSIGLPALTLLLGTQILRALFPLLLYVLGDSMGWTAVNIGLLALVVMSLSFLANLLRKLLGARVLLIVCVVGVGVTRLALQLWPDYPLGYLLLCLVGTFCFVLFFPIYLAALRPSGPQEMGTFAFGLQIGLILAVLFNGLYDTYEFNWQPGLGNGLLALVLVFLQAGCLAGMLNQLPLAHQDQDVPLKSALLWGMIGPFMFLQLLLFINLAQASATTGLLLPATFALAMLAGLAGLLGVWSVASKGFGWVVLIIAGGIVWFIPFALFLIIGQFLLASCLTAVLLNLGLGNGRSGNSDRMHTARNLTIGNGIGWVLFVIFIFLYYAGYQIAFPFSNTILPPIAMLLVVLAGIAASYQLPKEARQQQPVIERSLAIFVLVLIAAVAFKFITWHTPESVSPSGAPVRVMTYNLHNGVNPYGQLDLEAIAQAIEAQDPDVIALQEVSRGWIVNGSADMLQWLSQRLEMPYVWGTTEGLTWGNAVLSRYPITSSETHALPTEDLLLERGFILAQIDSGTANPLNVINTHYHHIEADSALRVPQSQAILDFWAGRPFTLIMGDLNAEPDTPEMTMIRDAGFTEAFAAAGITPGYTYSSVDPYTQLDYIWYTADLTADGVVIPTATASDHLGIAATISGN